MLAALGALQAATKAQHPDLAVALGALQPGQSGSKSYAQLYQSLRGLRGKAGAATVSDADADAGADAHAGSCVVCRNDGGESALHLACAKGNVAVVNEKK